MSNIKEDKISLDFYKSKYKSGLEEYFLPEEQLKYTGLPLESIEICQKEKDR